MSFLVWIVLGLVAGFIASKIVNKRGEGMLLDTVLGVVGAVVGGWLFGFLGRRRERFEFVQFARGCSRRHSSSIHISRHSPDYVG